ncbi:Uncharacterised protein [Brucella melitensis]|nr:Uncharacterised protein [Brucella melitensis]
MGYGRQKPSGEAEISLKTVRFGVLYLFFDCFTLHTGRVAGCRSKG